MNVYDDSRVHSQLYTGQPVAAVGKPECATPQELSEGGTRAKFFSSHTGSPDLEERLTASEHGRVRAEHEATEHD